MIKLTKTLFDGPDGALLKAEYFTDANALYDGSGPYQTLYVTAGSLAGLKRELMQVAEREIDEALDQLLGDGVLYSS